MNPTPSPAQAPPSPGRADDMAHIVALVTVDGLGPRRLRDVIARFGSAAAAWRADAADLAPIVTAPVAERLVSLRARRSPEAIMAAVHACGAHVLPLVDPRYPPLLAQTATPPFVLFVRGDIAPLAGPAVAVVGTRAATAYGRDATWRIVAPLARQGIVIVSGLALGIDAAAHDAALEAGGSTVAVVAGGIDGVYPPQHVELHARIIAGGGCVVSECAPGVEPVAGRFPARNRIIAGLSLACVVVEAGMRSGALITASCALEEGRDVLAVPGPITSDRSHGAHGLISAGAALATSAEDVLAVLDLDRRAADSDARRQLPDDPAEAALVAALSDRPSAADELARRTGLDAATVGGALALLELKGLARQAGGRWTAARR
ncbi:MAG: DNA-protecting protein DprA [Ardenticatenales bacterium]|nr:DNA-protecting protein DprA [Ardenticatenales bacterium]